jgi:hypothetical protein
LAARLSGFAGEERADVMVTIEILSWKDFVGGTAWDAHAKSELRKRLRSGVNAPLHEVKRLARQIHARELVLLQNIREEAVLGVTQILQAMGAQVSVKLEDGNSERLFKKWPKR